MKRSFSTAPNGAVKKVLKHNELFVLINTDELLGCRGGRVLGSEHCRDNGA